MAARNSCVEHFPSVRVLALDRNLGFGGGSNAGFRAAKNDIVVLLNSDMRVERDFLAPLLEAFTDETVFSVACQIFFSDPNKLREETGLTQLWWENGSLRVRHRDDPAIQVPYPCAYGGGGSCAFDRRKFLELGGFDELLAPFYMEDTDVGYLAWKRGWKVLYQPRSVVYHEHRGTIGKKFTAAQIDLVLKKNFALFCWKNIHEWRRLISHFFFSYAGAVVTVLFGDSPERANFRGIVAGIPAIAWGTTVAVAGAALGRHRRYRGVSPAAGRLLSRPLSQASERTRLRTAERAFRFALSDLSADPRRRRFHVSDRARIEPPVRIAFAHPAGSSLAARAAPGAGDAGGVGGISGANRSAGRNSSAPFFRTRCANSPARSSSGGCIARCSCARSTWCSSNTRRSSQYGGDYRRLGCVLFEHDIYFQSIARGSAESARA